MKILLHSLKSNLSRALLCPRFLLSVLIGIVILLMGVWDVIQMRGNNVTYLLFWFMHLGTFQMLLVCVPAMVYSDSLLEDAKGASVRFSVQRIGVTTYLAVRYVATILVGFIVMVVSCGAFFGGLSLFMPVDDAAGNMVLADIVTGSYIQLVREGKCLEYILVNILHQGICGMFYAGFALMCSAFIDNSFVVVAAPLLLYQWSGTIRDLLGLGYSFADIQFCTTDMATVAEALPYAFTRFFLLTVLCGIVFMWRGRRCVQHAV